SVVTLAPGWQQSLSGALQTTDSGNAVLLMDQPTGNKLVQSLSREMERVASMGHNPILLCPARLRLALRRFTERSLSALTILSYSRSEEHTSELQSRVDLVCRLLLEKKKTTIMYYIYKHRRMRSGNEISA